MSEKIKKHSKKFVALICMLALVFSFFVANETNAALSSVKDTLSDSRFNTSSDHTIAFTIKAGDLTASDTIQIAFEEDFDTSSVVFADIDIADDTDDYTLDEGACSSNELGVTGIGTDTITFTLCTSTTIADEEPITIEIGSNAGGTAHITNPASATCGTGNDSYVCDIDITTSDESGKAKVAIVSGVDITATVTESLSFTIGTTALEFGTIDGANIRYTTASGGSNTEPSDGEPCVLTLSTNAAGGATITIHDVGNGSGSAGLYKSAAPTHLMAATAPSGVGGTTESYAPYGKNAASNLSIEAGFETNGGTAVTASPQTFITASGALSTNNTADLLAKAGISASTAAGSYTDTLILVATPTY